jgi:hypothetical protein
MNAGLIEVTPGHKLILEFVKKELIPATRELQDLAVDCSSAGMGFFESLTRTKLNTIEATYLEKSQQFMSIYKKWADPNELFISLRPTNDKESGKIIGPYISMKPAVQEYFDEGFRVISYIQTYITTQSTSLYNRLAVLLSVLAITISVIIAILK